jgi:hypothetical protein
MSVTSSSQLDFWNCSRLSLAAEPAQQYICETGIKSFEPCVLCNLGDGDPYKLFFPGFLVTAIFLSFCLWVAISNKTFDCTQAFLVVLEVFHVGFVGNDPLANSNLRTRCDC